jgi:hypothetical protein
MRHWKTLSGGAVVLMLLLCATFAFAQAPTASIKIEGYSPQEIHDLGWVSPRSTGLSNVGIGQVVYLVGSEAGGETVTAFAWTLASKPDGSTAVLDSSDTWQTTFRPDLEGEYMVELVVTTAGGTSDPDSARVTAGKFVGVGGMDGLPSNPADGQCSLCHNVNFNEWTQTGHSNMLERGIDGQLAPFYNEGCIECHTTGYDSTSTAVNDGFDDIQAEVGWAFPDTLKEGNYADLLTNFPKLAHRANIQCESCHGPGSQHKGDKTKIAMSLDEATCGYCHEEEPYHTKNIQWKESRHAEGVGFASTRAGCNQCHSGWGFIRRIDPIQNDTRPSLGAEQISCAVCHDQHRATLEHQVRSLDDVLLGDSTTVVSFGGTGKLCMQCHVGRRNAESYASDPGNLSRFFGPHSSNQADMLAGANAIEYGIPIGSSGHKLAVADACVTCHMQATPADGEPGAGKVGEHTFAVEWDGGTPDDPSDDVENIAVCQSCHGPIESFDTIMATADFDEDGTIESTHDETEGLLEKLGTLLPPVGDPEVNTALPDYDWSVGGLAPEEIAHRQALTKAAFNYRFVEEDGSHGVHNAGYAFALMRRSIASLTTGDVGTGDIISITDVPNDQGKQVRLAWSKFPGDGLSANPLDNYSLWRRVDDSVGKVAEAKTIASKDELIAMANANNLGQSFTIANDGSWDFVGWVPAVGREVYSTVVPTLFDSTDAGIHWSVFFVAGHAINRTFETAADSGYSVDNLAPSTPGNITLNITAKSVGFQWDDPIDPDFRYFAVYRSTESGFDPKGAEPLATLISTEFTDETVEVGTAYYYRFSAFDFSGNESTFSQEFMATVTSIGENNSVPTEYALLQNYPNPFNPETTIEYQLPEAGQVRITIYSILGVPIRTLVDRSQPVGHYKINWDGRDNAGGLMPSGLYFYRIESGNFSAMKKMIMMK